MKEFIYFFFLLKKFIDKRKISSSSPCSSLDMWCSTWCSCWSVSARLFFTWLSSKIYFRLYLLQINNFVSDTRCSYWMRCQWSGAAATWDTVCTWWGGLLLAIISSILFLCDEELIYSYPGKGEARSGQSTHCSVPSHLLCHLPDGLPHRAQPPSVPGTASPVWCTCNPAV